MNTSNIRIEIEIKALANERGFKGYSPLRKAGLVALLDFESTSNQKEIPVAPPRKEGKRGAVQPVDEKKADLW